MAIASNYPNLRPSLLLDFAEGQQLDPRVTFSRSTTAPYYDGKTSVLAEQNLLLQSQSFDNASWSKSNVTVIADSTTAPDGTTTADSVITTAVNTVHRVKQSVTGTGTFTFSLYIKPNGYTKFGIWDDTTSGAYSSFDCTGSGSVLASGSGGSSATIIALSNGWYRIFFTATISGTIGFAAQILDPTYTTGSINNPWLADGTSGVFLWGAQVEQRSSVTAYNATTTTAITNYIPQLLTAPINAPRFDFNPTTGESLGLLIEQSSTNLLTYSQDFTNAVWNWNGGVTLTSGANIAPDGTQTAYQMKIDTSIGLHRVAKSPTVIVGQSYNSSFYVKAGTATKIGILPVNGAQPYNYTNTHIVVFDLAVGNVIYVGANSNSVLANCLLTSVGNGWYRISVGSTNAPFTSAAFSIVMIDQTTPTNYSFTGNGTDYFYIWGAQLEALSFPTSYIATTSAQVTRASDIANMTGTNFSSWYNQGQGTLYGEANTLVSSGYALLAGIYNNDGTTNNVAEMYAKGGSVASRINIALNGTNYTAYPGNFPTNSFAKLGFSFSSTVGIGVQASGTAVTVSYPYIPQTLNTLFIGQRYSGGLSINGWIKKIAYYPQALTSAQLQALTGS